MLSRARGGERQQSDVNPLSIEEPAQRKRLFYLDWLRVLAVLGVFVAHTGDIFDTLYWHTRNGGQGMSWNALATFGAEWGMSLVFLLAGASAWFALLSRSGNQFIGERFKRLLIPFLVAFVLLSPFQAFLLSYFIASGYSLFHGTLLQFFPYFFKHMHIGSDLRFLTIYGYHLWFLAFLFLISMMALPLLLYVKRERGMRFISWLAVFCQRPAALFMFVLPLALVRMSLWAFFPGYQGWTDFYSWFVLFVCGFIMFSNNRFEMAIRKQGKIFLPVACMCMLTLLASNVFGILNDWEKASGYSPVYLCYQLLLSIASWSMTVSALYLAMRFLNFHNKVLQYANEAVLPFYVIHQPVILIIAFYVLAWDMPTRVKYVFVSMAALIATLVVYELLIRRFKPLRWLFGMKTSQRHIPVHTGQSGASAK
jgi:peptidoglycan/LPS O-acetylase OafA/YrhL